MLDLETLIPVGHDNPVTRQQLIKKTGLPDRLIRSAIEHSDLPIINVGNGYYIVDKDDEVDLAEQAEYIADERSRIRAIEEKLRRKFGQEPGAEPGED